jgi:hypothetical protein
MSVFDMAPRPMGEMRKVIDPEEAYGYDPVEEQQEEEGNFLDRMLADMKAKRQRSMQQMQGMG